LETELCLAFPASAGVWAKTGQFNPVDIDRPP